MSRPVDTRPLYVRMLRLRRLNPGGMLCFLYFEGTVTLGILMALAELAPWWGVPILPLTVAALVKINDVAAAATAPPGRRRGAGPGYRT
jgi:hypothetical protein